MMDANKLTQLKRFCRDEEAFRELLAYLGEKDNLYFQMFECNQAIQILIDPGAAQVVDVNPAAATYYGYPREHMRGMSLKILNRATDGEIAQRFAWVLNQERSSFEVKHYLASGEARDVEIHASRVETTEKTLLTGIITDITERKQAENSLRESENRFRSLLNFAPDAIVIVNKQGEIVLVNEQAELMFGYAQSELTPQKVEILVPEAFRQIHASHRADYNNHPYTREMGSGLALAGLRKDGTTFPVEVRLSPIDMNGEMLIAAVVRDVTVRKQMETALKESETLLQAVTRNIPNGAIVMFDHALRYLFADGAGLAVGGLDKEKMVGHTIDEVFPPETVQSIESLYRYALSGGESVHEVPYGDRFYLVRHTPVRDEYENIIAGMAITLDITERKLLEEALVDSQKLYLSVITAMAEGIVFHDAEGNILMSNVAAERILGLTYDQLKGRTSIDPHWRAIHEDGTDFPGETHPAMVTLRTGQPQRNVMMGVHKPDGSLTWISINSQPLKRAGETKPYAVVASFADVTERVLAEKELRASEEKLKQIFEFSTDAIIVAVTTPPRIIMVNTAFERLVGIPREEIIGHPTVAPDVWANPQEHENFRLAVLEQQGEVRDFEATFRSRDGTLTTGLISNQNIQLSGEACQMSVIRDITQRKQDVERLRASEEKFATFFYLNPDAILIRSLVDERIVAVNNATKKILGYSSEELIGMPISQLDVWVNPQQRLDAVEVILRKGALDPIEAQFKRKDETIFTGLISAQPIEIESEPCIMSLTRDITEFRRLEQQKINFELHEEKLSLLRQFLGNAAHDLKTPITTMKTSVYVLRKTQDEEKKARQLAKLEFQIDRLNTLLEDMFTMLRLDTGLEFDFEDGDVNEIVEEVLAQCASSAHHKNQTLELIKEIESGIITLDRRYLKRALHDVVVNAIAYTPEAGHILLRTFRQGNELVIEVRDSGIGISAEDLPHIFDRFYRADASRNSERGGTGLGLTIANRIVEAHTGHLTVKSAVGQGSTFQMRIPYLHHSFS